MGPLLLNLVFSGGGDDELTALSDSLRPPFDLLHYPFLLLLELNSLEAQ